jgi:hypothetical protein
VRQERIEPAPFAEPQWDAMSASELFAAVPGRRTDRDAELDLAVIAWAARFAFVTVATLAERWGVSEQRMGVRVRRLGREGLLRRVRRGANVPARIVVTERGGDAIGLTVRTAQGREWLGHELAVIKRVIAIERHFAVHGPAGARVLTERDMRRAERGEDGERWSVEVLTPHGRRGKRWPDYAVDSPVGRTAVELEFSIKAPRRLHSIIRGYLDDRNYRYVDFLLLDRPRDVALRRSLTRIIERERELDIARSFPGLADLSPTIRLVDWRDPLPRLHAGIAPFPATPAVEGWRRAD